MRPDSLTVMLMAFANRLKFKELFLLILTLFLLDLVIPDMIPMIDEIILGLLTLLLASIKKEPGKPDQNQPKGNVIEGEVIKNEGNSRHKI